MHIEMLFPNGSSFVVAVTCDNKRLRAHFRDFFGVFIPQHELDQGSTECHVRFQRHKQGDNAQIDEALHETSQLASAGHECIYLANADQSIVCHRDLHWCANITPRETTFHYLDSDRTRVDGRMYIRAIMEQFLFSRGWILYHAACIDQGTSSILIVGDKGCGKTTTAMQLVDRGFSLVSNDRTFLSIHDSRVWAIPRPSFTRLGGQTIDTTGFLRHKRRTIEELCGTDEQGKYCIEGSLSFLGVEEKKLSRVAGCVITDIFGTSHVGDNRVIEDGVINTARGLAALEFFHKGTTPPAPNEVIRAVKALPRSRQEQFDFDSTARFLQYSITQGAT